MRDSAALASSALSAFFSTRRKRRLSWSVLARLRASLSLSQMMVLKPARAATWAIPPPIWPAPMMPMVLMEIMGRGYQEEVTERRSDGETERRRDRRDEETEEGKRQ